MCAVCNKEKGARQYIVEITFFRAYKRTVISSLKHADLLYLRTKKGEVRIAAVG